MVSCQPLFGETTEQELNHIPFGDFLTPDQTLRDETKGFVLEPHEFLGCLAMQFKTFLINSPEKPVN